MSRSSRDRKRQSESRSRSRSRSSSRQNRKHRDRERDRNRDRDSRSNSHKQDRRSRDRSNSIERRRRDRSKSCERYSRKRSRSCERRDRDRDRVRNRNLDRDRDRYNNSGSSSSKSAYDHSSSYGSSSRNKRSSSFDEMCSKYQNNPHGGTSNTNFYKTQQPNRTLLLSNISMSVNEKDIFEEIMATKLTPKDIRLIRRPSSVEQRGFAFIDFGTLDDAVEFMDLKKGVITFKDNYKSYLQYSINKGPVSGSYERNLCPRSSSDWFCIKCNEYNFKKRDHCNHCNSSRLSSELGDTGCDEISEYPTKRVMLRNLDVLTEEDSISVKLKSLLGDKFHLIQNLLLSKDPLTSTSRGICYLEMKNVFESVAVFNVLMVTKFSIDDKEISVTYCKYKAGEVSAAVESFVNLGMVNESCVHSANDLEQLAEYSALKYAKTSAEFDHYYQYYKKFFGEQVSLGESINLNRDALRLPEIAGSDGPKSLEFSDQTMDIPTGTDHKKYTTPDPTKFKYDESTGYHYDLTTGLYFDSSNNLYYNGVLQRYMYWDDANKSYVHMANIDKDKKAKKSDKKSKSDNTDNGDKVKVAKKITKDLEKWAKSLNQKRDTNRATGVPSSEILSPVFQTENKPKIDLNVPNVPVEDKMVESEISTFDNIGLDWKKLVCILCQRQFSSRELLYKHQTVSELHKKNLQDHLNVNKVPTNPKSNDIEPTTIKYRDRAKERRMKFGETATAPLEQPPQVITSATPISSSNRGSKMLQKMGWTEGQGLGKQNQGRTTIIEADGRLNSAGLGSEYSVVTHGDSYVESAKKIMYARYQNMPEPL